MWAHLPRTAGNVVCTIAAKWAAIDRVFAQEHNNLSPTVRKYIEELLQHSKDRTFYLISSTASRKMPSAYVQHPEVSANGRVQACQDFDDDGQ